MHRYIILTILAGLRLTLGAQAAPDAPMRQYAQYRVDAANLWPALVTAAPYYERESQGRIQIQPAPGACARRQLATPIATVCVIPTQSSRSEPSEGSVLRTGLRWTMELPSADFFGHEFGHVLGLADLYDPSVPVAARRGGSMMGWVDGRQHPLSLYSLRELGWSLVRDHNRSVQHFALFLGDQYRWCQYGECYALGFHHRMTDTARPEPWLLEGEWSQQTAAPETIPAISRLQSRSLGFEAERGLWQIPQAVLTARDPGWLEWFYVPDPVPRVLVSLQATDRPSPTSSHTESITATPPQDPLAELTSPEPRTPTSATDEHPWRVPLAVAGASILFVIAWRLVRRRSA